MNGVGRSHANHGQVSRCEPFPKVLLRSGYSGMPARRRHSARCSRSPASLKTIPATTLPIVASGWIAKQCVTNSRARSTWPSFAQHPATWRQHIGTAGHARSKSVKRLRIAAQHELGDAKRRPVPRTGNTGPCAVHCRKGGFSASSARPIRERSTPRSALVVGLAGLTSTARSGNAPSARSKHRRSNKESPSRRGSFPPLRFDSSLRQRERAIEECGRSRDPALPIQSQDHRQQAVRKRVFGVESIARSKERLALLPLSRLDPKLQPVGLHQRS